MAFVDLKKTTPVFFGESRPLLRGCCKQDNLRCATKLHTHAYFSGWPSINIPKVANRLGRNVMIRPLVA